MRILWYNFDIKFMDEINSDMSKFERMGQSIEIPKDIYVRWGIRSDISTILKLKMMKLNLPFVGSRL